MAGCVPDRYCIAGRCYQNKFIEKNKTKKKLSFAGMKDSVQGEGT